jgi:hypothetical protein
MKNRTCSLLISFFLASGIFSLILSCGDVIEESQDFRPNKAPVISSFSGKRYDEKAYDKDNLISNTTFLLSAEAYDPEGKEISFAYSSESGSFTKQEDDDTTSSIIFVTGNLTAGEIVEVTLAVSDPKTKNNISSKKITLGKGKPVPVLTVSDGSRSVSSGKTESLSVSISAAAATMAGGGAAVLTLSPDCDGYFQLIADNSISLESDAHIVDGNNVFGIRVSDEPSINGTIVGYSCTDGPGTHFVKIPSSEKGTYKVWIVFCDYLNQEAAVLCKVTVE